MSWGHFVEIAQIFFLDKCRKQKKGFFQVVNIKILFLERLEIVNLVFVWKSLAKKENHLIVNNTLNVMLNDLHHGTEFN